MFDYWNEIHSCFNKLYPVDDEFAYEKRVDYCVLKENFVERKLMFFDEVFPLNVYVQ